MMISSVQEAQAAQRRQSRAPGPPFSVPLLSGVADLMPVVPSFQPPPACPASGTAPAAPSPTGVDVGAWFGRSVGSGQCVALVQAADPSLGHTSGWVGGAAVQGNTALKPGTPIATFNGADRYANALDGSSHAALYLGQDSRGMLVLDQWAGSSAAVRRVPWSNPGGTPANTGSAFRVINRA